MNNLNEIIVRIKADTSSFNNPIDVLRSEIPQFWRGNDIKFEIGIFNGNDVLSVSNYGSISLAIRKLTDDGKVPPASTPALMQKICTSFDDTLTSETWEDGTKQHAVIPFSSAESNVVTGDHWLSVWATTVDSTPKIITLCAGIIRILEVGGGNLSTPPDPVKIYYTSNECDNRFIPLTAIDANTNLGTSDSVVPSQKAVKTYVDRHSTSGSGEIISASNVGTGIGVFKEKIDGDLKFKTLKSGNNVTIEANASEITISSSGTASSDGMANPMTAKGDLIVGGESGAATRLEKGSSGQVLKSTSDGLGWSEESSSYTLPTASADTLGGIKVGSNLSIANGVLSADGQTYTLPIATASILGGIKPDGTTITVNPSTGEASAIGGEGGGSGNSDDWVPSLQYVDLTYGASGDAYTAPTDGWVYVKCTTSNTNAYIIGEVMNGENLVTYSNGATTYSTSRNLYLLFPVGSDYVFRMFNSNLTVNTFRFIYAKGSVPPQLE
ncbi:MAG: hypothetical protein LBQ23_00560 [Puniceicoccales bacterium]|jgi:hypothetical protein|nr:hypothetical protein [Puniceicoccales bacterium]